METKRKKRDVFAGIAGEQAAAGVEGLKEPGPPRLPAVFLPTDTSDSSAAFKPRRKLDTPEKLQQELAKQRRIHARFLADLAPAVDPLRVVVPLEEFDWRIEAGPDAADFSRVLRGEGSWQKVKIPHFGGPLGRAVSYYRTAFSLDEVMLAKGSQFACFKGVDYKAHIFVNGCFIGSHEGFFAPFDLDFSAAARPGMNEIVVKVENDAICMGNESYGADGHLYEGDKLYAATGPGWDDPEIGWHHCPPGMGIYQGVSIEARAPLHFSDLFIRPLPDEGRAEAWVEIFNCHTVRKKCSLELSLFGQNFRATVLRDKPFPLTGPLGPRTNYFVFSIPLPDHRSWDIDSPWLYQAQGKLVDEQGKALDTIARQFGMRSFRIDESASPKGMYFLNGRALRLRGANTMGFEQQSVMRRDWDRLRDDILLAKICHLNFFRLTQRPVQKEVYDFCDRLGMLTQTDLPLFGWLRKSQFVEAVRQAQEMERLVRGHPCNVVISYINEPFPDKSETAFRHVSRQELLRFFTAASEVVRKENPDRVIKPVDGDYSPPAPGLPDNHCYTYWYTGHGLDAGRLNKGYWQKVKPGWLYGCGEFGTEGLDHVETMRRFYPRGWLPQNADEEKDWTPDHIVQAQTGRFHHMWFDTQHSVKDWVARSQEHQAWATRMMTEAFRRDSRMVSCAIHLFIDAFPSGWMKSIMDVRREPKPAWFAYREALTPLMVNLRTDRYAFTGGERIGLEAWVCNDRDVAPEDMFLHYQVERGSEILFSRRVKALVPSNGSRFQGFIRFPAPRTASRAGLLIRAAVADDRGKVLHDTSVSVDVFPAQLQKVRRRVVIVGARKGVAERLAAELGCAAVRTSVPGPADTILIDDMDSYRKAAGSVGAAVRRGARAVFLDLPPGRHKIGADFVDVAPCGMGGRHFVSRATGHPLVAEFAPMDFRFWYNPAKEMATPLLESSFVAEGWTAILRSGDGKGLSDTSWRSTLAAAERPVGRGSFLVCQLSLAGRTRTNPVARIFATRLLNGDAQGGNP